jgi:hypothetical protein
LCGVNRHIAQLEHVAESFGEGERNGMDELTREKILFAQKAIVSGLLLSIIHVA